MPCRLTGKFTDGTHRAFRADRQCQLNASVDRSRGLRAVPRRRFRLRQSHRVLGWRAIGSRTAHAR